MFLRFQKNAAREGAPSRPLCTTQEMEKVSDEVSDEILEATIRGHEALTTFGELGGPPGSRSRHLGIKRDMQTVVRCCAGR